jgi:hypothetical protein
MEHGVTRYSATKARLLQPPPPPGKLQPDSGAREVGETAVIGYFTQHPPPVDPSLRLVDYVSSPSQCPARPQPRSWAAPRRAAAPRD